MRTLLMLCALLVIVGCQKAEPQSTQSRPYEAERLKTLTHDTDLIAPKESGPADLRSVGEALRDAATPAPETP